MTKRLAGGILWTPPGLDGSTKRVSAFWAFVRERHMVWHRRFVLGLLPPWTDDVILRKYKFCNVYRELDRGTQWWVDNVGRAPMAPGERVFKTALYRLSSSSTDAWDSVGGLPRIDQDLRAYFGRLRDAWKGGAFRFNRAYSLISVPAGVDIIGRLQHAAEVNRDRAPFVALAVAEAGRPEAAFSALQSLWGFGPFLAYQVYLDLATVGLLPFEYGDWAHVGPGASPVLGWMLDGWWQASELDMLRALRESQWAYLGDDFPYWREHRLELPDIEHSLCEWRKYLAVQTGHAGGRTLFRPRAVL